MQSIWKDEIMTLPTGVHQFRIKDAGGNIIYEGRAEARPGTTQAQVRINDICADYMAAHALPVFNGEAFVPQMLSEVFTFQYKSGASWSAGTDVEFLADWSYDYSYNPDLDGLSFPISLHLDGRQMLYVGLVADPDVTSVNAVIHFADGTHITKVVSIRRTADYNEDYGGDYATEDGEYKPYGVAVLNLANYTGIVRVEMLGRAYDVDYCNRYALHYVNAYGGWDSFLPAKYELMQDTYTRHTIRTAYDNGSSENRGERNYANEVSRGIAFHTDTLTDEGAVNMQHLIGSTCVYMQDLQTGLMYPVVLTDASCAFKTFRNQGGKRVTYSFNVRLAHDMIRR